MKLHLVKNKQVSEFYTAMYNRYHDRKQRTD